MSGWDDLADVCRAAQITFLVWAFAVAAALGIYLCWLGWSAFWAAFGELRWLGLR